MNFLGIETAMIAFDDMEQDRIEETIINRFRMMSDTGKRLLFADVMCSKSFYELPIKESAKIIKINNGRAKP